jgi:predicted nucleotidyltransferase
MVDRSIIKKVRQYVALIPESFGVKKAYLFGSFAQGKEQEASDIDIAIVLDHMPDFFDAQSRLMKLRRKIDLRIEPHPIKVEDFNAFNPFAFEIEKTGVEIEVGKREG